jgi:hypothetical protein
MRMLGALLALLLLAAPALAQQPAATPVSTAAKPATTAAKPGTAAPAGQPPSLVESYARRCLVTLATMRAEAPQTAIPPSCGELPGFDGQPRDLSGSKIKESPDGFTETVSKKGGGGITLQGKTGAVASIPVGGKTVCHPGLCTAQCCCEPSPAGRSVCCRFVPGKPAACD